MIRVYKRTFGILRLLAEFNPSFYEIIISTGGVLTIRRHGERDSVLALNPEEWSVARREDK